MPTTYEIDHERRRVIARATIELRAEDFTALVSSLALDRCLHYALLIDGRHASLVLTADETRRLVGLVARLRAEHGHARTAFVAGSDLAFGMGRMYMTLAAETDPGFMVYRAIEDAEAWLGWADARTAQPRP